MDLINYINSVVDINKLLKFIDTLCFEQKSLSTIEYDNTNKIYYINLDMKYFDVIEDYLNNGKLNKELLYAIA